MTTVRIYADWLLDVARGRPVQGAVITIEENVITDVREKAIPTEADVIFHDCTVLPGLIDAHVHLCFSAANTHAEVVSALVAENEDQLLRRACDNAQQALHFGVTTVRDCGGPARIPFLVRQLIRRGEIIGPDVLISGQPITTPRGHLHYIGSLATSAEEVAEQATKLLEEGAEFVKLIVTGGNMTPESDRLGCQYEIAQIKAAVRCAEQAGSYVAAHVLNREGLKRAALAGVRTLEHCSWRIAANQHVFDPELARMIREQGQIASLTMSAPTWRKIVRDKANLDTHLFGDLDDRFASERAMLESGVRFILHTDAGVRQTPFGISLIYGLLSAQYELGLSPMECLQAVTVHAAEALGLQDRGQVQAGKRADLLIVAGQPWRDLSTLQQVHAVWCGGRRWR